MGRNLKNVRNNVLLCLNNDTIGDEELKVKIDKLDDKVQQMLLWSTICAVWSYMFLILAIARVYSSFKGDHTILLVSSLVLMYVLMGVLIYFVWKGITFKSSYFNSVSRAYLSNQIQKLSGQRKLVSYYLLEYGLLLAVASLFFFLDIKNGVSYMLKLTAPVSIITYGLGLYFIANFTRQMKALDLVQRQLNKLHVSPVNQN
ncbi:hypothetical protein [Mucilaginibacter xinganensis]|uniref:Uncharacterized protein n=1 Tax=Mucilaginibacter xinganensis TaxID=1234841 RepID=A0A223NQ33_9SPHI|nr:hypothetical protein [Mucilaginibacter xinganensis]ASU32009.1 hypothetical protein MuYL_0106 [Mucilaginibacter xinganensis]